jgi:hypothetical protein
VGSFETMFRLLPCEFEHLVDSPFFPMVLKCLKAFMKGYALHIKTKNDTAQLHDSFHNVPPNQRALWSIQC